MSAVEPVGSNATNRSDGTNAHMSSVPSNERFSDEKSKEVEAWRPPWVPLGIILCVELCERLTYYTLAGSQKTYLNKQLGHSSSSAASMNSVFSMLCYMWCLPGGLLADVVGRYKVIVGLASIYGIGTVLVAIASYFEWQQQLARLFMVGALGLIPLGTGGIKPNICNFGADQIGDETQAQRDTQKSFFSFFYLSINIGVVFAFGFLVNVTTHGLPNMGVAKDDGYFVAYAVAAASMILAVVMFVLGTKFYDIQPGGGVDGFMTMVQSLAKTAAKGKCWKAYVAAMGWLLLPVFFTCTVASAMATSPAEEIMETIGLQNETNFTNLTLNVSLPRHHPGGEEQTFANAYEESCSVQAAAEDAPTRRRLHGGSGGGSSAVGHLLTNLALAAGTVSCICLVVAHISNDWIRPLPKGQSAFTIEEVREGFAVVPLIVVINLSYSLSYNAMNNALPSQACQMNTILGGSQLNGAFFTLGDAIAIIIFTPLFESVMYPYIGRLTGREVSLSCKLITGLVIVALANLVAGLMEIKRRSAPLMCWEETSECAPNGIHMRDMSAMWIFIPNALIGASEILVNPSMYYYAYTRAPTRVRSLVQAFNLFFQGSVSNAFTAVATKVAFPNDLDSGNLEHYYYINVVAALVGILIYLYLLRSESAAQDSEISGADGDQYL